MLARHLLLLQADDAHKTWIKIVLWKSFKKIEGGFFGLKHETATFGKMTPPQRESDNAS